MSDDRQSGDDPLVNRIDALMRKRRSFVAADAASARHPEEEDIPELTEIVDLSQLSDASTEGGTLPIEPIIQALANELAHAIEYRLKTDLPGVLDSAIDKLALDLRRGVAGVLEAAVLDFLGRRQQLRLPFPDTPPGKPPSGD
ncbi:MAG TPA: hypothetical protein VIS73_01195 [Rhodocyclaceae bacterium]